ncbi:MAG: hypothetical protein QGH39_00635 [Candidatus Thermoplasmatota archaeon]|nr:hypothetical protein [Candidatus Thermoplasmatota archaeon]MDP7264048.1 hypothetical protein [Candidatus Thermoplasmatota archaeon]
MGWTLDDNTLFTSCEGPDNNRDGFEYWAIGAWDLTSGNLSLKNVREGTYSPSISTFACFSFLYNSMWKTLTIYENHGDEDGIPDRYDAFPYDPAASNDSDNDGSPDKWNPGMNEKDSTTGLYLDAWPTDPAASLDSDGDGYPDRWTGGMGANDSTSGLTRLDGIPFDPAASLDTDGDGWPDEWNEGCTELNSSTGLKLDEYPSDPTQWIDSDGDGFGDNYTGNLPDRFLSDPSASKDTDMDGYPDWWNEGKSALDSNTNLKLDDFPFNSTQWNDTDSDGWGDNYGNTSWSTNRKVGEYVPNAYKPDRFPLDNTQWNDTDGDEYGDNISGNNPDRFPNDKWDWNDTDLDGIGDNSDYDIDGDRWNNTIETEVGTDPFDINSFPGDIDNDGIPDQLDKDIDGDGWNNSIEAEVGTDSRNNSSYPGDFDEDGIPDLLDEDIDNDGYLNENDSHPFDPEKYQDITDQNGTTAGNNTDWNHTQWPPDEEKPPGVTKNPEDGTDDAMDQDDEQKSHIWVWTIGFIVILIILGAIGGLYLFTRKRGNAIEKKEVEADDSMNTKKEI